MSEVDGTDGPVTVLVARRVVPGREIEFEEWASELTRAASHFDGFLGAGLLHPGHVASCGTSSTGSPQPKTSNDGNTRGPGPTCWLTVSR
jgi:hypothetical protein